MTTDSDETRPWREERGFQLRSEAQSLFEKALDPEGGTPVEREAWARQALSREGSAFNWLEDSEWEEAAHNELHRMGKTVHDLFPEGCQLEWTGTRYEHRCPVRIVHKRFGFSPSLRVGKKLCMICDGDASECPHLPNRIYPVVASRDVDGRCRICHESSCDHHPGTEYPTRMSVEITEIVAMDEVSIVPRPVQPDARLIGVPIDTARLEEALGEGFSPGMAVHCSMCELPCDGVDRLPGDPRLEGQELPVQKRFERTGECGRLLKLRRDSLGLIKTPRCL